MDRPGAGGIEIACAGAGEGIVSDDRDIGHPVMVLPGKPLFFLLTFWFPPASTSRWLSAISPK
jgi:hypothetical protein